MLSGNSVVLRPMFAFWGVNRLPVFARSLGLIILCLIWADYGMAQTNWRSVNMGWETSCEPDRGSISRSRKVITFRTSSNNCVGGIFNQRAELHSKFISVNRRITYMFESTISMQTDSREGFIFFQVHDGRNGCSPPMSLRWRENNTLSFDSNYTRDQGMDGCVVNHELQNARFSGPRLRRDGTPFNFRAILEFDGDGNFDITVFIDGVQVLGGHYQPSDDPSFVASPRFYMKHGVYSQFVWPYEMRSEGIRVLRARN